jgi:glucose/arabinose dehydrogenase
VERRGTVRVYENGAVKAGYFLDLRSVVDDSAGERGLLGLAFHPSFETNRRVYVYYTRSGGDIVVARLRANAGGTAVSASTRESILAIEHSTYGNHNGGAMAFGPDGYLYIGTGDGGGAGDPLRNGQSKTKNLLGKILRIHVGASGSGPYDRYAIPSTNPFRGSISGLDEVWAYGLRNPWRISFDRATGSLYIADVGQNRYEEINREPAGYKGGRNYGWNVMEGKHCYNASSCNTSGKFLPVAEYSHASGGNCSITGGYVYRGTDYPDLVGQYVLADFCSGRFYTMPANGSSLWMRRDTSLNVTSFGEGEDGELYAVTINGRLYQIGTK